MLVIWAIVLVLLGLGLIIDGCEEERMRPARIWIGGEYHDPTWRFVGGFLCLFGAITSFFLRNFLRAFSKTLTENQS